ncbi:MAG: phytoene desaturase [Rhodocyclaceae bacterium]|nr:phytoene desaturase [Rhodocyclaceae bacterium]
MPDGSLPSVPGGIEHGRALKDHRTVVVGAGIGGLVTALQLACAGVQVTVVERAATPGGKMRRVEAGCASVDSGPTVFTMRWVFEQIFAGAGASLDERLKLSPLPVLARHAWRDGSRLDLFADHERSVDAIGDFAGAAEAKRFRAFCRQARDVYDALEGPYIRSSRPSLVGMGSSLGMRGVKELVKLGPFTSLASKLARQFVDPRLRQLFGRYATYCGSSPWSAPATLLLVAQVEMDGVWSVDGGMHGLACAIATLAAERGVTFRYGTAVDEILVRGGRACGVVLAGDERIDADSVVFNGDAHALASGCLGEAVSGSVDRVPHAARSLSAVTWSMHARTAGFPLDNHNVFFDDDYASEFSDIFGSGRLPSKPTVYICAQDRAAGMARAPVPGSRERLLCLVNAPATGDTRPLESSEIDACEHRMQALLSHCGLKLEIDPASTVRTTPHDFERLFPATGGSLYGRATQGWMALFKRSGSSSRLPGLYLAGGSVHPGPGVPMAAMSGQLAAATLLGHLGSTSRSTRVVISGGMSTRSVTTAAMA